MLSQREIAQMLEIAQAPDTERDLKVQLIARIMTSGVSDQESLADMTEFVRKILRAVTLKFERTTDPAARLVCWRMLIALSEAAARTSDDAPEDEDHE